MTKNNSNSSSSSTEMFKPRSEGLKRAAAATQVSENLIGIDLEMLNGRVIAIGIQELKLGDLDGTGKIPKGTRIPLLHPSRVEEAHEDAFWSKHSELISDMIYTGDLDEKAMLEEARDKLIGVLTSAVESSKISFKIREDRIMKGNLDIVVGTINDVIWLTHMGVDLTKIGSYSRRRVVILDQIYRGCVSPAEIPVIENNVYKSAMRKSPGIVKVYKSIKVILGSTKTHDCVDDCRNNLALYLAHCFGATEEATYEKFSELLNF